MGDRNEIICLGELLWDALPTGLFLGGAPLNVCLHLHELGERAAVASRVGKDRLGKEVYRRLKARGVDTSLIQRDEDLETGFVEVDINRPDDPAYTIISPVAWDKIAFTDTLAERAQNAWALLFGSLGQRGEHSRKSTRSLLQLEGPMKVFDMNLRVPHFDRSVIETSLEAADMFKMNGEELAVLQKWFTLPRDTEKAIVALSNKFSCEIICLTKGEEGSVLYMNRIFAGHPGYRVDVADTVGAGDAFLAATLHGIRKGMEPGQILSFANGVGAFVASRPGGTPLYTKEQVEELIKDEA